MTIRAANKPCARCGKAPRERRSYCYDCDVTKRKEGELRRAGTPCARCGVNPRRSDGAYCQPCTTHRIRLRKYRLTEEQFATMVEQHKSCANPFCDGEASHIDHDSSCCSTYSSQICGECIRGMLCAGCNIALGCVGDSIEKLAGLIEYLRRYHG